MPNQLQTREYWRTADREPVEQYAIGRHTSDTFVVGLARAELARRDQEWSEEQEADRCAWEAEREQSRRQFETELADKQLRAAMAKATKQSMIAAFASSLGAIVQTVMAVAIYFR